jgi:hypothetical protein
MCTAESDSVRVSAARALMDKVNKDQEDKGHDSQPKAEERDAAIAEARRLLADIAAAQSKRARRKAKMA